MPGFKFQKNSNFNPMLIISQIFLISSIHYIIYIIFTILFNTLFGLKLHIDQILSSESLDFQTNYGIAALCVLFFTNLLMIGVYVLIVDKANKILDYVLTIFFIHLILTTFNSHFPSQFLWWIIHGIFLTLVTLIAEFIALKLDQRDIHLDFKFTDVKDKI